MDKGVSIPVSETSIIEQILTAIKSLDVGRKNTLLHTKDDRYFLASKVLFIFGFNS